MLEKPDFSLRHKLGSGAALREGDPDALRCFQYIEMDSTRLLVRSAKLS